MLKRTPSKVTKTVTKSNAYRSLMMPGQIWMAYRKQFLFIKNGKLKITKIDNENKTYSVKDFMKLPEGIPIQLINGKLITEAPRTTLHQIISGNLSMLIYHYVKLNNLGKAFYGPLDVHLDKFNVYQPDILFIANSRKGIIKNYVHGAPNFIVEILSESTKRFDKKEKFQGYERYNVLEYWIINPKTQDLFIYLNKKEKMKLHKSFSKKGKVKSTVIKGFAFQLAEIFED